MKRLTDILPRLAARPARVRLLAAAAVLLGVGLTAAALSTSAATPGEGAGAITPFLGTWKGAFPPDPTLPGTEIEVRLSEGEPEAPEAIVTLYRHVKGADGRVTSDSVVVPALDVTATPRALIFRTRAVLRFKEGAPRQIVDHMETLELAGPGRAVLHIEPLRHREGFPPPPPPMAMTRER